MNRLISTRLLVLVAVLSGFMLGSLAAATFMRRNKVFEELRAFADIPSLRVDVDPLPPALTDVNLRADMIRERVENVIEKSEIKLTDDPSAPKLHLKTAVISDEMYPDVVGFILFIDLVQKTRIVRLDEEIFLPTATIPLFALRPKAELARTFSDKVDDGLRRVTVAIQMASDNRARVRGSKPSR